LGWKRYRIAPPSGSERCLTKADSSELEATQN